MRKLIVAIIIITSNYYVMAQHTADLGVQVAAATYWGDIENVAYSKSITPVVGILGRYNFNKRTAVRGQLFTGNLNAEGFFSNANIGQPDIKYVDETSNSVYYEKDASQSYNFNRAFQSVEGLFEFNFRNYKLGSTKKEMFTPFVEVGLGFFYSRAPRVGTFILEPTATTPTPATMPAAPPSTDLYYPYNSDPAAINIKKSNNWDVMTLTVPVGMGIKFNITKTLGGIVEVIVRKTFSDNIDNLDDPKRFQNPDMIPYGDNYQDPQHGINNTDWYATLAVSVCYQLWSSKGNCAVYDKNKY